VILTMPDTMSVERRKLLKAYGAEVVLTEGAKGMQGAIDEAMRLCDEIPNSYMPSQFDNPSNPAAHFETTGPEIWEDTDGAVDIFIACVGTGGTVTGVGNFLKARSVNIHVFAVQPAESPLLTQGRIGTHGIQGIGANFVPAALDREMLDGIIPVTTADAYTQARLFVEKEGLMVGISSGAALQAAVTLAALPENAGKTIVALLPDSGERYLSTTLFDV
jgi:cysteine synthase A